MFVFNEQNLFTHGQEGRYGTRSHGLVYYDFLVEMEPGRRLLDMGGLVIELQQLLGHNVDVVTERGLKNRIGDRVLAEAIPL